MRPDLIGLDRRLDLLHLAVLEELHDRLGRLGRDALLQRDDPADRVVCGALEISRGQVLGRDAAPDHAPRRISQRAFSLNSSSATRVMVFSARFRSTAAGILEVVALRDFLRLIHGVVHFLEIDAGGDIE